MLPDAILQDAETLLAACRSKGIMLAIAESCTGGLIAAALTAIPGASDVVDRAFVTYSNDAKNQLTGVPMKLIKGFGAISEEVARAMAEGALARSLAAIAISVTGIAGPGGGGVQKPVGLVCFGLARTAPAGKAAVSERRIFPGDRAAVRGAAVAHAFGMIKAAL